MRKSRPGSRSDFPLSSASNLSNEEAPYLGAMPTEYSGSDKKHGIVVVGSDRLFREGLKLFLENAGLAVMADGKNPTELWEELRPDCVPDVLIHSLPSGGMGQDDLSCIQDVRQKFPSIRIIALAEAITPSVFLQTISAGIEGLLLKDISGDVLQRAIGLVLLGQHLFPAGLAQNLLPAAGTQANAAPAALDQRPIGPVPGVERERTVMFSEREQQILQCLVGGFSNKAIARKLHIAEATVKVHVKGLLRKVQVSNRTQAAIWALSRGIKTTAPQQIAAE
jgi:two-component system nitrate/nitrite response regulator NarL